MTASLPEFGGCVWPADFGAQQAQWDDFEAHQKEIALQLATMTLQRLTGYRVSACPIKLRPCIQRPRAASLVGVYAGLGTGFQAPENWAGVWSNVCHCAGTCTCATSCEVALPPPVTRVDEVRCNGTVVDPADYIVQNSHLLVWTGAGDCPWVLDQDMSKPDTEPGTMSVTYLNAHPVDSAGAYAVARLALEYAKAYSGKGTCYLPKNVTSLVRQGVAMEIMSGAFPNGLTGLREVDAYIGAWNPGRLTRPPTVYSPDMPRHRVEA